MARVMGGPAPANPPAEVVVYELARCFHVAPSTILQEPAVLMRRVMMVMEMEAQAERVHQQYTKANAKA